MSKVLANSVRILAATAADESAGFATRSAAATDLIKAARALKKHVDEQAVEVARAKLRAAAHEVL